ncbi:unnamed protein product [Coregonus sp. 'balchen']|nr:unnamed protein product [Coregonus sp. 'balchen']
MSKLQSFCVFLNERLMTDDVEIFGAVEKTVVEYQEENDRLRRMLRITPEIKLCRIGTYRLTASAAIEIFSAVEKTVLEYQEENDLLRRLLRITPEIQLCRIGSYLDILKL